MLPVISLAVGLAEEPPRALCAAQGRSDKMAKLAHLGLGTGESPKQVPVAKPE